MDLIEKQNLFTVYVNSQAYASEEFSIFTNYVIKDPMDTKEGYAEFVLVNATLRMLHFALKNNRNR